MPPKSTKRYRLPRSSTPLEMFVLAKVCESATRVKGKISNLKGNIERSLPQEQPLWSSHDTEVQFSEFVASFTCSWLHTVCSRTIVCAREAKKVCVLCAGLEVSTKVAQGLVEDISPLVEQLCEQQGHDTTTFYANRPKSAAEDLIASQPRHEEKITLSVVSST